MADKVAEHKHCPVCGRSMGGNDRFCSPECEQALVKQRKKQQRTMYIFMGVLVLLFVVMLAFPNACSSLLGGGTTARP